MSFENVSNQEFDRRKFQDLQTEVFRHETKTRNKYCIESQKDKKRKDFVLLNLPPNFADFLRVFYRTWRDIFDAKFLFIEKLRIIDWLGESIIDKNQMFFPSSRMTNLTEFDVFSDKNVNLDLRNLSGFASKKHFPVLKCSFYNPSDNKLQAAPVEIEKFKKFRIDLNLLLGEKRLIIGGKSAIKATLQGKLDVIESSSDAWKILARCVSGGLIETSKALLQKVLEENEDRAPLGDLLMLAADAGQHRLIQHLLEIEVSLDSVTDDDGRTALTRACMTGQVRAAKVLLDHGANALHKDKDGLTSIQLAEKLGHYQIVRLFDGK
uniref:ANK_REP_REGION domain-containing protein n=1 Tax=Macrostomum lignano TaxID=282301 RepID=A0A1I8I0M2_9PLAT